ncbi:ribosome dissociation factor GTPase [Martiniozyma asiatica (nom. inval.)]|nr:ribosome dissociation factor GTPase [Martiniozyma asiatica]
MSNPNNDPNNLANQFGKMNFDPNQSFQYDPNQSFQYNPNQSFQYNPNAQGYNNYNQGQQGYNNQGYNNYNQGYNQGYNNYNQGYNNYNQGYQQGYDQFQQQQQQPNSNQMTMEDFEKQKAAAEPAKPKVKKVLKLSGSSSIKIGGAKKPVVKKEEPKEEAKPAQTAVAKEESKPAQAATPVESRASSTAASPAPKSSTPAPADISKEQEDTIDPAVVNDMFGGKDHCSIIFMGHVDAGKSTMGGNILYLTGAVDKRTVEKYEREAKDAGRQGWYLSWIMDTNKEERNDGKTIEVGKSYFETDKRRYTILDAPGHKLYVSEMIGGASQADVGVLVISARKGEYEAGFERGGQSREHAILAKTQGVNRLVVVINKMDDATVGWSEDRYKECISKLGMFLKGVGYAKDDVVYMPVSGFTGAGLKERIPSDQCPWYKGPALLEYLDNLPLEQRKINDPFMLPVSGKMKDLGTVVEGKIESGHIKKNQNLILMPNKVNVEILTIYNETEAEADSAFCGEQVRLRLKNIEEEDVMPGYVLTSPRNPVHTVTRFEAQVAIVELKSILSSGFSCVMHVHTAIEEITFVQLLHKLEKGTNRKSKKPPAFAKQGMKIIAILEVPEPVCLETYEDYPQLGRFTLRDQGQTIAIGKVTKLLN